jgi:hypothetical protein
MTGKNDGEDRNTVMASARRRADLGDRPTRPLQAGLIRGETPGGATGHFRLNCLVNRRSRPVS